MLLSFNEEKFYIKARLEEVNQRIWVEEYLSFSPKDMNGFILDLAASNDVGKIILPVKEEDVATWQMLGYSREGIIPGYFNGTDAHFMALFPCGERAISRWAQAEKELLNDILQRPRGIFRGVPGHYTLRQAGLGDIFGLTRLFREVFESYPSPVYDPSYLASCIKKGDIYMVARDNSTLAGTAAAEIEPLNQRAELTNCAMYVKHRGQGLSTLMLQQLEKMCLQRNITCLFSLARASSYGMNLVFHRLGYGYFGTLVNNCHISGNLESMNIWVKHC